MMMSYCVCRVVLSVNDKWHYCHNSQVLVGSRSMRDRHLRLLGYTLLQVHTHTHTHCLSLTATLSSVLA